MRKKQTIRLNEKLITVRGLKLKEIEQIFYRARVDIDRLEQNPLQDIFQDFLSRCSNVSLEDLLSMTPSEIKTLYQAFKKVNGVFFKVGRDMGLSGVLQDFKLSIQMFLWAAADKRSDDPEALAKAMAPDPKDQERILADQKRLEDQLANELIKISKEKWG